MQRRIGRIRVARSDDSRLKDLPDPGSLEGLEDDPRALGLQLQDVVVLVNAGEIGLQLGEHFRGKTFLVDAGWPFAHGLERREKFRIEEPRSVGAIVRPTVLPSSMKGLSKLGEKMTWFPIRRATR